MPNTEFDAATYSKLLAELAPRVIEDDKEYDRLLPIAERMTFAKNLSPEEAALYKLIIRLIEAYETEKYPFDKLEPYEVLQHIMESSGTKQSDLVGVIGSSGVVSEVVNGKRGISKKQAKALGARFRVSPSLFLGL